MIFWLFKRCQHEYVEVDDFINIDYESGMTFHKVLLYCPKCEKQKKMYYQDWLHQKKIKEIKNKYKN